MLPLSSILATNLTHVRQRIASACERAGRPSNEVTLVAVTKYAELDWVRALVDLGEIELGESRPQQLVSRAKQLPSTINWHLIGHLQRNKVDSVLPVAKLIHSVDSLRLIEAISKAATKSYSSQTSKILLEVNVSGEAAKDGFDPAELTANWSTVRSLPGISIEGLMTMAPLADSPEAARPVFRALSQFRDQLAETSAGQCPLPVLSMGMSGDFEVAIEEGATVIRIGSSLFEGLGNND